MFFPSKSVECLVLLSFYYYHMFFCETKLYSKIVLWSIIVDVMESLPQVIQWLSISLQLCMFMFPFSHMWSTCLLFTVEPFGSVACFILLWSVSVLLLCFTGLWRLLGGGCSCWIYASNKVSVYSFYYCMLLINNGIVKLSKFFDPLQCLTLPFRMAFGEWGVSVETIGRNTKASSVSALSQNLVK